MRAVSKHPWAGWVDGQRARVPLGRGDSAETRKQTGACASRREEWYRMRRRGYGYGYGAYHGRSGVRTFLKILIVLLLVLLALVVAAFFLLERYRVYDGQGVRLEIPFLSGLGGEDPPPAESLSGGLVVVSPSPTPQPEPEYLHAVLLPRTALYDGTAQAQMEAAGGRAAIFDMKADDGTLGYVSDLAIAKSIGASAADPALNAAIRGLCGGELYTVARVSCFRDNIAPYQRNVLGMKTHSGYNWRDERGLRWMSPTSEEARQYVTDVCVELAALGFDEILLDNAAYPTAGKLQNIKQGAAYDPVAFAGVVEGLYSQIREALAPYPQVKLSIVTDPETITNGANPSSGQATKTLVAVADRLWLTPVEGEWALYTGSVGALGLEPEVALVSMGSAPGQADQSWAVFPQ